MKTVLITGTSSGIGSSTKELFLKAGYKVIGLDIKEDQEVQNYIFYKVDITDEEKINDILEKLKVENVFLDVIVNIAGIHKMASLVENDFYELKKVVDINLLGPMLVNNKFHKLLKDKGKIIIVTSEVATLDPLPFNGLYSISKIALEQYAHALRQELNLINQKVITILPGAIETPLQNGSLEATENLAKNTTLYKDESKKFVKITKKFMGKPLKPVKVAKLIVRVTNKRRNKLTYKIHRNLGLVLLNLLPKRLQCYIIKKIL